MKSATVSDFMMVAGLYMSNEKVIQQIIDEIKIPDDKKKDIYLPYSKLRINNDRELYTIDKDEDFYGTLTPTAIMHLFTKVDMPLPYMKRLMKQKPQMVTDQFNFWVRTIPELRKATALIRAVKEENSETYKIRAVLSDKYVIFDNAQLFEALLDSLSIPIPELELDFIVNNENTFYIRLIFPQMVQNYGSDTNPDNVYLGVDIINSEVGYSALLINPILWRENDATAIRACKKEDVLTCRHIYTDVSDLGRLMCNSLNHSLGAGLNLQKTLKKAHKKKIDNAEKFFKERGSKVHLTKNLTTKTAEHYEAMDGATLFDAVFAIAHTASELESTEMRFKTETALCELLY